MTQVSKLTVDSVAVSKIMCFAGFRDAKQHSNGSTGGFYLFLKTSDPPTFFFNPDKLLGCLVAKLLNLGVGFVASFLSIFYFFRFFKKK